MAISQGSEGRGNPPGVTDRDGVRWSYALTSDRPYKEAWSVENTVAEMETQSGKLFDPNVLNTFMSLLPEMVEITQQFSDSSQQLVRIQRKIS